MEEMSIKERKVKLRTEKFGEHSRKLQRMKKLHEKQRLMLQFLRNEIRENMRMEISLKCSWQPTRPHNLNNNRTVGIRN